MINIKKLKKINSIRKEIGALASDNEFFSRSEVESLLDKINPSFDRMSVSLEDMLKVGVRGWSPQTTIPSHPNLKNVNLIFTAPFHEQTTRTQSNIRRSTSNKRSDGSRRDGRSIDRYRLSANRNMEYN